MKNECTSHNSIVMAMCAKNITFGGDLTKFKQKTS